MIALAVVLAVLGAVCSAVGARLQHSAVRAEAAADSLSLRSLGRLARNRRWRLGVVVLVLCAVLQVLALAFAPVAVIAPIVVLALPVVALLSGRLNQVSALAVGAVTVAVGVFVSLNVGVVADRAITPAAVWNAVQIVAAAGAGLVILGLLSRDVARSVALSAAAGASYGLVAILVRDVTTSVRIEGAVAWPSLAGLVVAFAAGAWLIQLGYASGPPDLVVGCQTAVNLLVATALGMTVLGETEGVSVGTVAALVGCAAVATTGIAVLARRHLVALPVDPPPRRPVGV